MWPIKLKIYYLLILVILSTYIAGMFVPIMEVDAAQYASISDQILHSNSILQIKHRDFEYLDKPPLLFCNFYKTFWREQFRLQDPLRIGIVIRCILHI